jgi:hypothetical protein
MRFTILFALFAFVSFELSSCTPLLVGGAAAGGAYAGYKAKEEGYKINITKEVKGSKKETNDEQ